MSAGRLPLAAAVRHAHHLSTNCAYDQAADLLTLHLAQLDPGTAGDDDNLIHAVLLLHLLDTTDHVDRLAWIRYAYQASRRLHGPHDRHTPSAANSIAAALTSAGDREAIIVHRDIIRAYTRLGHTDAVITARIALAGSLHSFGDSGDAVAEAAHAWHDWQHAHGTRHAATLMIALPYLAMLIACDRDLEALRVLAQAGSVLPPTGSPERARPRRTGWQRHRPHHETTRRDLRPHPRRPLPHRHRRQPASATAADRPAGAPDMITRFPGLNAARRRADGLTDAFHQSEAARLLAQALAGIDPITSPGDDGLITAAITYIFVAADDPDPQLTWALYAHQASHAWHAPLDHRSPRSRRPGPHLPTPRAHHRRRHHTPLPCVRLPADRQT